jgi:hypothetical protein
MITFDDFVNINEMYNQINLNDIQSDVKNSSQEFIDKIIDIFSLVIYKNSVKNIHPQKIKGYLNKDEFLTKKKNTRSSLSIKMNNDDIVIGTYNTSSFNVAISIQNEIIYDIHIKDCNDDKLIEKMLSEYIKYLKNKGYKIKNQQ